MSTAKKPELSAVNKEKPVTCSSRFLYKSITEIVMFRFFEWFQFCILLHYALHVQINHSGNTSFTVTLTVLYPMHLRVIVVRSVKLKAERNYRDAILNGKY